MPNVGHVSNVIFTYIEEIVDLQGKVKLTGNDHGEKFRKINNQGGGDDEVRPVWNEGH
jgi:hypothetical protein